MVAIDLDILNWVKETFHSQERLVWLGYLMKYISLLGDGGAVSIAVCVILLIFRKTRGAGVAVGFALVIDFLVVNVILKNAVGRERPWTHDELSWVSGFYERYGISLPEDASFPSGHTAVTFCAATVLVIIYRAKAIPAVVVAFLVGLSRIYLCVHFPTDVLGGMVAGTLCGVAGYFLYKYVRNLSFRLYSKYRYAIKVRVFRVRLSARKRPKTTAVINAAARKNRIF